MVLLPGFKAQLSRVLATPRTLPRKILSLLTGGKAHKCARSVMGFPNRSFPKILMILLKVFNVLT